MVSDNELNRAIEAVNSGGIIVYPTEAIFGLGCDPFNKKAVMKLLKLKHRGIEKGLILIASNINQVLPLIRPIHAKDLASALKTWPGHHTWVFPKTNLVPHWISGDYDSVAVRVSNHPVVKLLCNQLNKPLVSTSANISNHKVLKSLKEIKKTFNDKIQFYINAEVGNEKKSSQIHDAHSNKILR